MTSQEREQLEFAAKACGFEIENFLEKNRIVRRDVDGQPIYWNPFTNLVDRYKLLRELGITVDFLSGIITLQGRVVGSFNPGNDAEEAKAIVGVAAKIGKEMK